MDGGYIITGIKAQYGAETGSEQFWLIKTDFLGNREWDKTFATNGLGWGGKCVRQTSDGGYIIIGSGDPYNVGHMRILLIKTDSLGNQEWYKTYGGSKSSWGASVQITDDGFIIAGSTYSSDMSKYEIWLIKTDFKGNIKWDQKFDSGSLNMMLPFDSPSESLLLQTRDGGYVIVGSTKSSIADADVWLIKTDSEGKCEHVDRSIK